MNILFLAQGSAINIYHQLIPYLKQEMTLDQIGFYVAGARVFKTHASKYPEYGNKTYSLLKEWEILKDFKKYKINHTKIENYEKMLGDPYLWNALIEDRRIFMGKHCKHTQNYVPRYSHKEMLQLLGLSCERIETFLNTLKPNAIIGFNMNTYGEYLIYLFAKHYQISYRQIKGTKIENYTTLHEYPVLPSKEVKKWQTMNKPTEKATIQAQQYIQKMAQKKKQYEGDVAQHRSSMFKLIKNSFQARQFAAAVAYEWLHRTKYSFDHQFDGGIIPYWKANISKPTRGIIHDTYLKKRFADTKKINKLPYVFFPLHTEPEIALTIYGKSYQNQIEAIRNIARSIPVTWKVVVKDHARSVGLRSLQYYNKLLEIPNVLLVQPYHPIQDVMQNAKAIVTISGWAGFEAAIMKKPVVILGECSYNVLPETMIKKCVSPNNLEKDIQDAVTHYQYDESAIVEYVATLIDNSRPLNMYTDLLHKPDRHGIPSTDEEKQKHLSVFARFIADTFNQPRQL